MGISDGQSSFGEVFRKTQTEGPQRIIRQGKEGVVMISDEQHHRLVAESRQQKSIVQFFGESPLVGVELDLERTKIPDAICESRF